MRWTWTRMDSLGVHGLYEVLALRCRVFILEQGPYLDPEGATMPTRCWPICVSSTRASSTPSRRSAASSPHPKCVAAAWAEC